MKRLLIPIAGLVLLAGGASAYVSKIDPTATLSANGQRVRVTGPLTCAKGERVALRVTVTQRSTGAVAQGRWRKACTGGDQHWKLWAVKLGPETFKPGAAEACALGVTRKNGKATDAHQWCGDVTLGSAA